MNLPRDDVSFRKEHLEDILKKEKITIFRPGDRKYPNRRGYIEREVVKARIIEVPGDDSKNIPPKFINLAKLVKIKTIHIMNLDNLEEKDFQNSFSSIKDKNALIQNLNHIYNKKIYNMITKIDIEKVNTNNLIDNSNEVRELFQSGILKFAQLPKESIKDIDTLFGKENFSLTFIDHDYAGITPMMWNHIAQKYNISLGTSMVVADPKNLDKILSILVRNNKYIGGGLGVGFKDSGYELLKTHSYGFIQPVADAMQSINFVAHFGDEIHGSNSDASGYVESLEDIFKEKSQSLQGKNILLLGAGGTTRGIALELALRGVNKITILNRTTQKAQSISENINNQRPGVAHFASEDDIKNIINQDIDAIINLTTKGADGSFSQYSGLTPVTTIEENLSSSRKFLEKIFSKNSDVIISDINLTQSQTTPLLEQARDIGFQTLDGKAMVVYQGVEAIWTVFGDKIIEKGGTKEEVKQELMKLILKK